MAIRMDACLYKRQSRSRLSLFLLNATLNSMPDKSGLMSAHEGFLQICIIFSPSRKTKIDKNSANLVGMECEIRRGKMLPIH